MYVDMLTATFHVHPIQLKLSDHETVIGLSFEYNHTDTKNILKFITESK